MTPPPNNTDPDKNRHEYFLMEVRLSAEDVKEYTRNLIDSLMEKRIVPLEKRTTSLEDTRTFATGVAKTLGVGVPALGSFAYFFWKVREAIKASGH